MWRPPRLIAAGWVRRAGPRVWFRVVVLFGLPWRHPFLRTGEEGVRLIKHFNTCEYDEMKARWGATRTAGSTLPIWVPTRKADAHGAYRVADCLRGGDLSVLRVVRQCRGMAWPAPQHRDHGGRNHLGRLRHSAAGVR